MSGARASVFLGESRALDDDWALNDSLSIAYNTSASGTIVLDVGAWYLTVKGNLIVGHNSPGTLNLGTGNVSVIPASNNLGTYIGLDSGSVGIVNVDGGIFTFGYNNNTQSTVDNGMFLIEKGSVTLNGNGHLVLGRNTNSPGTMTVKSGGSYTGTGNNLGLIVGWESLGTLNIEGGTVTLKNLTFCIDSGAVGSEVNITDGGVLQANLIKGWNASSSAKLIIDGGTLKARENDTPFSTYCSGLNIYAGDDGAVFDSNGRNITIDKKIEDKSGEAGKVRFSGGGSIALSGANTYTGGTTIELGTKVVAMTDAAKAAVIDNGLVVDGTGLATAGDYTVFEYSGGTLTDADLANVSFRKCGLSTTKEIVGGNSVVIHFEPFAWELNADRTWSELAATYGTPAADEVLQITVTDSDAVLTVDQDATVSQLVFTSGSATTLLVNEDKTLTADNITGIGKITNNGTIVKTGAESISLPFDNASTGMTVINAGQVNVKSVTGSGSAQTIVVKSGATFDMNGYAVTTGSVRLEDGATLKNDRTNIRNDTHQITNFILDGDATVNVVKFFGLCGSLDAATTLNIGEHTLTVDGNGFWLVNTTIEGGGEIVANGVLSVPKGSSSGADCTLTIASGGTLHGNGTLSVKNFTNNGIINNTDMLTVTGTLTPANEIPRLTLASGATIKATGTAQVVSTEFSASGTITVDASEIDALTLKAAGETGIPVLTVPTAQVPSGLNWPVSSEPIAGTRAKWRIDEGGKTKTLYIARFSGLMVIIR